MPTVSKPIARQLARNNGWFEGDRMQVIKIVEYENAFDGKLAYGLIYEGMPLDAYSETYYVRNPRIYWEVSQGPKELP
jgi:hypothetical protein